MKNPKTDLRFEPKTWRVVETFALDIGFDLKGALEKIPYTVTDERFCEYETVYNGDGTYTMPSGEVRNGGSCHWNHFYQRIALEIGKIKGIVKVSMAPKGFLRYSIESKNSSTDHGEIHKKINDIIGGVIDELIGWRP